MVLSEENVKEALKSLTVEKETAMGQANFILGKISAFEEVLSHLAEPDQAAPVKKESKKIVKSKEDGD